MGKARIEGMRSLILIGLLACAVGVQGQSSNQSTPPNSPTPDSAASAKAKPASPGPNSAPPRSDRIDASALADGPGESSSKDTQIDISPPPGDDKEHPQSSNDFDADGDITEFRLWDPHRAAKDIEVGDFYFKRQNYVGAESRYREALMYKENDATATFKLAECLFKMKRLDEALAEYESYLKILPNGPEAPLAKKAIERLNGAPAPAKQLK
jgi:tetratricopeptide (TPR) repeat protein